MANAYIGDANGKARKIKSAYIGDENGKARKIIKMYIGDETGKARAFFDTTDEPVPPTPTTKTYYWDKYDYSTVTTYYGDSDWGASEDHDVQSVSGYTSYSFTSTSGFVGSGSGTITQTGGNDVYEVSSTEVYRYYYDSSRNMICRQRRTCDVMNEEVTGDYIGQVSSTYAGEYPTDGAQGGYWYVYDRSETA